LPKRWQIKDVGIPAPHIEQNTILISEKEYILLIINVKTYKLFLKEYLIISQNKRGILAQKTNSMIFFEYRI
jgi:hypothetical protein